MKKQLAIIGAGPAALLLAAFLDPKKFEVNIYEQNKAAGRKFLVAGKGGFNLTHAEDINTFVEKYTPSAFLEKALNEFSNEDLRKWLNQIGIPTFVGSSKRVYPEKGIKPIMVLKSITTYLEEKNTSFNFEHKWTGWTQSGALKFEVQKTQEEKLVEADYIVYALGGGSWKVTGSDGSWQKYFSDKGILTREFEAVNCAYGVNWSSGFINQYEGRPLKNLAVACNGQIQKGEAVITRFGLEGNAIYGLSSKIAIEFSKQETASIYLDLKPMFSAEEIQRKLEESKEKNRTTCLRKALKLNSLQLALVKELIPKEVFLADFKKLSKALKGLRVALASKSPIDEAISTTGGIDLAALSTSYELHELPKNYCIGEMIDWNAPTGGYLLQACFSMGVNLARYLNNQNAH